MISWRSGRYSPQKVIPVMDSQYGVVVTITCIGGVDVIHEQLLCNLQHDYCHERVIVGDNV